MCPPLLRLWDPRRNDASEAQAGHRDKSTRLAQAAPGALPPCALRWAAGPGTAGAVVPALSIGEIRRAPMLRSQPEGPHPAAMLPERRRAAAGACRGRPGNLQTLSAATHSSS